ncbi:MAG: hypothetical protein NTX26_02245 [Candidatus Parcubacteria bacterium]|nr:hypothetical protein [Candidatus Parcubacteria bacterium]
MNKKIVWAIIVIVLLALITIGILGCIKAQKIKTQAKQIKQITADTLNLKSIREDEFELPIQDWENIAEKAGEIKVELNKLDKAPALLREDMLVFYSEEALRRAKETKFLQLLIDGQRQIGLQEPISEKSKGQIETTLDRIGNFKNNFDQEKLFFIGSDIDPLILKLQTEELNFENYLKGLYGKMTYEDKKVTVDANSLSNAAEELKIKLTKSLNDWVLLQEKIEQGISNMEKVFWVNPF